MFKERKEFDCLQTDCWLSFLGVKGDLLIAKSRRGKERIRHLSYLNDLKETLGAQKGLFAKCCLKKSLTLQPFCSKDLSFVLKYL